MVPGVSPVSTKLVDGVNAIGAPFAAHEVAGDADVVGRRGPAHVSVLDENVGVPPVTTGALGGVGLDAAVGDELEVEDRRRRWLVGPGGARPRSCCRRREAASAGTWYSNHVVSSAPEVKTLARVVAVSAPVGRLSRTTSTPLT